MRGHFCTRHSELGNTFLCWVQRQNLEMVIKTEYPRHPPSYRMRKNVPREVSGCLLVLSACASSHAGNVYDSLNWRNRMTYSFPLPHFRKKEQSMYFTTSDTTQTVSLSTSKSSRKGVGGGSLNTSPWGQHDNRLWKASPSSPSGTEWWTDWNVEGGTLSSLRFKII